MRRSRRSPVINRRIRREALSRPALLAWRRVARKFARITTEEAPRRNVGGGRGERGGGGLKWSERSLRGSPRGVSLRETDIIVAQRGPNDGHSRCAPVWPRDMQKSPSRCREYEGLRDDWPVIGSEGGGIGQERGRGRPRKIDLPSPFLVFFFGLAPFLREPENLRRANSTNKTDVYARFA